MIRLVATRTPRPRSKPRASGDDPHTDAETYESL